jgi:hypothetical protein
MRKIMMTGFVLFFTFFVFINCGSSTRVKKSIDIEMKFDIGELSAGKTKAPEHFLLAVKGYLKTELSSRELFDPDRKAKYRIYITMIKYRIRKGFSKKVFGILAGKDGVKSTVMVLDPETNEIIGESEVATTNLTKSITMDDIAHMHADEIVRFLTGKTH